MRFSSMILIFWDYSIFLDKFQVFLKDSLVEVTKDVVNFSQFALDVRGVVKEPT